MTQHEVPPLMLTSWHVDCRARPIMHKHHTMEKWLARRGKRVTGRIPLRTVVMAVRMGRLSCDGLRWPVLGGV